MSGLEGLEGRIGGFYEIVEILQWPRTQIHNRLRREGEKSGLWSPGELPRPFMRVHATPLFDLEEYYLFIQSPAYREHANYPGEFVASEIQRKRTISEWGL